ncbi:RNA-binding domain-containing protein [Vairimorpha necatrix]|uniref:RNA-binding domain-containing protein n=1 Tax=Vairimorpha necatrix TaxID=6039 RepID=A0AAX4JFZ9_9MICR
MERTKIKRDKIKKDHEDGKIKDKKRTHDDKIKAKEESKDKKRTHDRDDKTKYDRDDKKVKYEKDDKRTHDKDNKIHINTYVVNNLSYKETEETIKERFKKYGTVENVKLCYTKDQKFIGKAIITFKNRVKINEEITLGHKVLRIEKLKEKIVNDKRIFISRINKNISILEMRNIFKSHGVKPKDIRCRYETETKRNNGYCHITYNTAEEAKKFEEEWTRFKGKLGQETYYEYAQEKIKKRNKN